MGKKFGGTPPQQPSMLSIILLLSIIKYAKVCNPGFVTCPNCKVFIITYFFVEAREDTSCQSLHFIFEGAVISRCF